MARSADLWARLARLVMTLAVVLLATGTMQRAPAQAILRIAAWNTANRPNSAGDVETFQTILGVIGNEDVRGSAKRIDVLAWSETDTLLRRPPCRSPRV